MEIREPNNEQEWEQYYDLRWCVLREMCDQPPGSEKDDLEEDSYHLMATEEGKCVGVGRAHFNHGSEGQIRCMGVDVDCRGKGIGTKILEALEIYFLRNATGSVILNAHKEAVGFYQRYGYQVTGEEPLLFGAVEHVKMCKRLM
ncbi:MAG: GNAT family N-acetyltransferase [Planctomycetes bacterium]|nr:GNAT family N-acetyltransferase [Planctomycetota bacterium]